MNSIEFRSLSICTYLFNQSVPLNFIAFPSVHIYTYSTYLNHVSQDREREGRKEEQCLNGHTAKPTSSKGGTLYGKLNTVCIN